MLFFSNITALAFGPLLVGALSDFLAPRFGADSLRYALACASLICVAGAASYLSAGRYYFDDARTNSNPDAH
jgi:hypothetical protein